MIYLNFLKNKINKLLNRSIFQEEKFFYYLNQKKRAKLIKLSTISNSQLGQDLFVLDKLNFKSNGFFVEFGACDGKLLSNTFLLEKKFNWTGILCEPSRYYIKNLKKNRSCHIENKCVYSVTGKNLLFIDSKLKELSFINNFRPVDKFLKMDQYLLNRKAVNKYIVKSISINDLLKKYNCPKVFEYLSIDTEGTEYEIIKNLNFSQFRPKIITIEHNYNTPLRNNIYNLLIEQNYKRVLTKFSKWDDWYINKTTIK